MEENKPTILIVDDVEHNQVLLRDFVLTLGYPSMIANNGLEALMLIKETLPDLILLDVMMPNMDGLETLEALKSEDKFCKIPVIMISAMDEMDTVIDCIKKGAIDYLSKPFNPILLNARIESALANKKLQDKEDEYKKKIENYNLQLESDIWKQSHDLTQVQLGFIHRLASASEHRETQTESHVVRISHYCSKLGAALKWDKSRCDLIFKASPMYDVGKFGIPDRVLLKPEKLDHDEWDIMKTHSTIGASILKGGSSEIEIMAENIALTHHEKWDGTGYPKGLKGTEIPIEGRIVAIADVFDALTSEKPYKDAWTVEKAMKCIEEGSGTFFDPDLVQHFKQILPEIIQIKNQFSDRPTS